MSHSSLRKLSFLSKSLSSQRETQPPHSRSLRFEPLEDRRVLSVVTVTTVDDTVNINDSRTSLREAIFATNITEGPDEIRFDLPGEGPHLIELTEGELEITDNLTIRGGEEEGILIQQSAGELVFEVGRSRNDTYNFELSNLTLAGHRGILFNPVHGRLTLNNVDLSALSEDAEEGETVHGIFSRGDVTLLHSSVTGYTSTTASERGALYVLNGNVELVNSTVSGNASVRSGGGISSIFGDITITDSVVTGNVNTDSQRRSGGGGVYAKEGDIRIRDSVISDNVTEGPLSKGGGVYAVQGDVEVVDSLVTGNRTVGYGSDGGGLYAVVGELSVTRSTISNNSTFGPFASGGGLGSRYGTLTITDSTIEGNSVLGEYSSAGGAAAFLGDLVMSGSAVVRNVAASSDVQAGGLEAFFGAALITNSTISHNRLTGGGDARGAGIASLAALTLHNTTVYGNQIEGTSGTGGGIWNGGQDVVIRNSIVAGNLAEGGSPDFRRGTGTLDIDYSLIGDTADSSIDNRTGTGNLLNVDPLLAPLADNGGPTLTHALLPGSPALNAGDPDFETNGGDGDPETDDLPQFDQRAPIYPRVSLRRLDIGAFEQENAGIPPRGLIVDTVVDIIDYDYGPGQLALREAVALANLSPGEDAITFSQELTSQSIVLGGAPLIVTDSLNIRGPGHELLSIDANNQSRAIKVMASPDVRFTQSNLSIEGVTLTGGRLINDSGKGGGSVLFDSSGQLSIVNSAVTNNSTSHAMDSGGAIYTAGGDVIIEGSTFANNLTAGDDASGGAIFVGHGSLEVERSTFKSNSTAGQNASGGAISASNLDLRNSTITQNFTHGDGSNGAGIFARRNLDITNSTITDNVSSGSDAKGGGLSLLSSRARIINSTITGNRSGEAGGLYVRQGFPILLIRNSIIAKNQNYDLQDPYADFRYNAESATGSGRYITIQDNLFGQPVIELPTFADVSNNIVGVDPQLAPLADNGGPTQTHALLPGSPAIDMGDPNFDPTAFDPPLYADQRGAPFVRVAGGRIDIGAFEVQPEPAPYLAGDYSGDNTVTLADYTVWRDNLGATVDPYSGADGDGSGLNDTADYAVWKTNFGATLGGSLQAADAEDTVAGFFALGLKTSDVKVSPMTNTNVDFAREASFDALPTAAPEGVVLLLDDESEGELAPLLLNAGRDDVESDSQRQIANYRMASLADGAFALWD